MNTVLQQYLHSPPNSYEKQIAASEHLKKNADQKALSLFTLAAKRIPAYKDFLRQFSIKPELIKTINDFIEIPYTTKDNYILSYPIEQRCWDGDLTQAHMVAASSGSTGEPTFWPRQLDQEVEGALIHEYLFDRVFSVRTKKTLFVNSFGLGNWIAGMYTQICVYLNRLHDVPMTITNPGYNQEETFKVIRAFSHFYEQTIIACHPPILKMMIENGTKSGINWSKLNVKFLGAGEGFSENWRDYLVGLVQQTDIARTMINIYGSADAGLMGFETPLSIALHQETSTNHQLNQLLFNSERNPYLYQFDPTLRYLESINGNIAVTMNATMPLIKYNIKDQGDIVDNQHLISTISQQSSEFLNECKKIKILPADWPLPFVYIFGRDQFMISLYGVNIYPENLKAVFEHPDLQQHLTGRFSTEKMQDENQDHYLHIRLELKPSRRPSKYLAEKTRSIFIKTLKELNSEYNQVEDKFGTKMHPTFKFHKFQHPEFFPEGKTKKMG